MDFNQLVTFIPVSNLDLYMDWDSMGGFGGMDQIEVEGGIVVLKSREEEFKKHVNNFELEMEENQDN